MLSIDGRVIPNTNAGLGGVKSHCAPSREQEAEAFLARSVCESPLFLSFPFSITFLVTSRHHLAINGHQIKQLFTHVTVGGRALG